MPTPIITENYDETRYDSLQPVNVSEEKHNHNQLQNFITQPAIKLYDWLQHSIQFIHPGIHCGGYNQL